MTPRIVALVGPTASGKTGLAVRAVERSRVPAEIIVLDSRQLYRGLDVGTGKPDSEQRRRVPHHLLDCLDVRETPDAMDYRRRVEKVARAILSRGAVPFLVGGAGFYLRALREGFHRLDYRPEDLSKLRQELRTLSIEQLRARLRELDSVTADRLHPNDRYRIGRAIELSLLAGRPASRLEEEFAPRPVLGARFESVVLMPPRSTLHERIEARTTHWLQSGWGAEVRRLMESGVPTDAPGLRILGYRQVVQWVNGELDGAECRRRIVVATRRYARAQSTWFRKEKALLELENAEPAAVQQVAACLGRETGPA